MRTVETMLSGEYRKGRRRFKRADLSNLHVISQAKRTERNSLSKIAYVISLESRICSTFFNFLI